MRLIRILRRLRDDRSGLAFLEFGMSLPVLVTLSLAGLEAANYMISNMRASQIALMVADNASRIRDSIDEADINDLMLGAKLSGQAIDFASRGRIILSNLQVNATNTGNWIRWQRCSGALNATSSYGTQGKGLNDATLLGMGPTANRITAVGTNPIMFVEVVYRYKPLLSTGLLDEQTFRYTAAFTNRKRPSSDPTNTSNATASSCSTFSA